MKRREFSLGIVVGAAGLAALSAPGPALASAARPVEGTDYKKLESPLPEAKTGRVEVIEFFWYGCPHCYAFEPTIEPWIAKLPADVNFHRVPAVFSARWATHAQVYFTWETLGLVDAMHAKTFDRFHKQDKPINGEADMLAFAKESGLDVAKVKEAWNGFIVNSKMTQAKALEEAYGIDGVPTIGIHGRYTTSPSLDGADCLGATNTLIAQMRKIA